MNAYLSENLKPPTFEEFESKEWVLIEPTTMQVIEFQDVIDGLIREAVAKEMMRGEAMGL